MNQILSTTIIKLVTWIGLPTQSSRLTAISYGIFIAQFFNTGFLLMLVNANFSEFKSMPDWLRNLF